MTRERWVWVVIALAAILTWASLNRYHIEKCGGMACVMMDRWTGRVWIQEVPE